MVAIAALTFGSVRNVTDTCAPARTAAPEGSAGRDAATGRSPARRRPAGWLPAGTRTSLSGVAAPRSPARPRSCSPSPAACSARAPRSSQAGALLGIAVHLDDRVVHVDQHRAVQAGQHAAAAGQVDQEASYRAGSPTGTDSGADHVRTPFHAGTRSARSASPRCPRLAWCSGRPDALVIADGLLRARAPPWCHTGVLIPPTPGH